MRVSGGARRAVFLLSFLHQFLVGGCVLRTLVFCRGAAVAQPGRGGSHSLLFPETFAVLSARRLSAASTEPKEAGWPVWNRLQSAAPCVLRPLIHAFRRLAPDRVSSGDRSAHAEPSRASAAQEQPGNRPHRGPTDAFFGGFLSAAALSWAASFRCGQPRQQGVDSAGRDRNDKCHCPPRRAPQGIYCSIVCSRMGAQKKMLSTSPQKGGQTPDRTQGSMFQDPDHPDDRVIRAWIKEKIAKHKVVVFAMSYCPYCDTALEILRNAGVKDLGDVMIDRMDYTPQIQDILEEMTGARTVPRVFIDGIFFGGCSDLEEAEASGKLKEILSAAGAI
ncbi:glutaredoxin, putative [Toxoplasma gondii ME49]|uniref:Glutaredoxin, putative n=4 Tax=Toxoplasma gondii TaxID=5811 RepID=S8F139_TOXGM|nr:glutaredoxin, putative [Toxoplasma gondii ME49]EPT27213.1 glutaredoxin, putative [Toxoplasma gondii ME49]KYF43355.1 putative glutaredoxin [Toxoplasma gondii ARI]PIM03052.1 putative glutaredoxin [Toxoplasma gondii COUG]|eukprot:XP_002366368.1 glutaredoxin, putative [Toxoplasma gondii ME49]